MQNSSLYKSFAFTVAIIARLIHLPIMFVLVPLGFDIGETFVLNILITLWMCILVWLDWQLTHKFLVLDDKVKDKEQVDEFEWLIEHRHRDGYLLRAFKYFWSEPVLWKPYVSLMRSVIIPFNFGCYLVGWLAGVYDEYIDGTIGAISWDLFKELDLYGADIMHGFVYFVGIFIIQIVLYVVYFLILRDADSHTVDVMIRIDQTKR